MGLIGYDYLFLGHKLWPVESTIELTPAGSPIGFFDDVCGDPLPNFKKLRCVKNEDGTRKFPIYRVQMHYTPSHRLISTTQLTTRVKLYERIAAAKPDLTIYISHTTEYDSSDSAAVKKRIDIIKKYAPHCIPVNNVWKGVTPTDAIVETHELDKARRGVYLASTDGWTATQIDIESWHKTHEKSAIRFLWASRFNMRDASEPMPEPLLRTAYPSNDYFNAIVRLASAENLNGDPPKPEFRGRIIPIVEPLLWKAFAEDFPTGDVRGLKPLYISPSTAKYLSVITYQGKEVTKLKFYGNFPPNLHRHYVGSYADMWGYEIARKALRLSGSEFVWIKDGNTVYGPVNPAFRRGSFRGE